MYDVALVIQEDVAIVPVFHLQEVGDDTVGRTALDKVSLSGEELFRV